MRDTAAVPDSAILKAMVILAVFFFFSFSLWAQMGFHHLATTDDGKQLYFSSPLRMRGAQQYGHDKIFRLMDGRYELFAMEQLLPPATPQSNFYLLSEPDVSGDGTVASYVAWRTCLGVSSCVFVELNQSNILGPVPNAPITFTGRTRLSRSGRYAVQFGATGFRDRGVTLIDLPTGERTGVPGSVVGRQIVTSDGTVIVTIATDPNALTLWHKSGTRRIDTFHRPGDAAINDVGTRLVYEQAPASENGARNLLMVNLETGQQFVIVSGGTAWYQAGLSNDGRLLLYVAAPSPSSQQQVFVVNTDGSGRRQLTNAPEGINEAILSGSGNTVYAVTLENRLLRIDVPTGVVQGLTGRTPLISERLGATVPGSMNWIRGIGLSPVTQVAPYPLPESLAGVRVLVGGVPAKILLVAPGEIRFQIPFEARTGDSTVEASPGGFVFEQVPKEIRIEPQGPRFIRFGFEIPTSVEFGFTYLPVMAHWDFSGLVTDNSPAAPGETLVFYMTGLGAVTPAVASGQPAPLDELTWAAAPLRCWQTVNGVQNPLQVHFAGLAPGLVGIYQVNIQMPSAVTGNAVYMECASGDSPPNFAAVPVQGLSQLTFPF